MSNDRRDDDWSRTKVITTPKVEEQSVSINLLQLFSDNPNSVYSSGDCTSKYIIRGWNHYYVDTSAGTLVFIPNIPPSSLIKQEDK